MKTKIFGLMILMLFLLSGVALALPEVEYVKVNGDILEQNDQLVVKRGESFDVKVRLEANNTEENVKIEAYIDGYEYDDYEPFEDSTTIFDMEPGDTEVVTLNLKVPYRADKAFYDLKVRVGSRIGASFEGQYKISLKGLRHELIVKKILMSQDVVAGRGFFANVKVENIGQKDEEDITVRLEIPELGVSEFTTIDEIDAEDTTTSEDIVVFIDECTEAGEYDVIVTVEFDEFEDVSKTETLRVKESDICQKTAPGESKTLVSVPQAQEAIAGDAVVFPIMITNMANTAKTYVITVSKAVESFGTSRIDPSNVMIVQSNQHETVFIYLNVNEDAQEGAKDFIVTIQSGDEKQDIALTANIIAGTAGNGNFDINLKNALEIGLVVLLVILVLIGIIIGINRLKPKEEEEKPNDELGQTYY